MKTFQEELQHWLWPETYWGLVSVCLSCLGFVQHTWNRHSLHSTASCCTSLVPWRPLRECQLFSPASTCPIPASFSFKLLNPPVLSFKEDATSLHGVIASALHSAAFPPRPPARRKRYTITPGHLKWDHFNLTYKYGFVLALRGSTKWCQGLEFSCHGCKY